MGYRTEQSIDDDEQQEEQPPQEPEEEAPPSSRLDIAAQWKVFLTSVAGAGVIDLVAHGGWLGLAFGVGMSAVLAKQSPELYEVMKDMLPMGFIEQITRREEGKRSLLDRAMGWHPAEVQGITEEADDQDEDDGDADIDEHTGVRLPTAPLFRKMCHLIGPGRLVLCWTVNGPLYGTIEDLLSMVIIGKPGRGKTTALIYYVAILLKAGAEVHVWDPHGSLSELAGTFERLHYLDDLSDLPESVAALTRELEARRLLYKQIRERIKEVKRPLLLLVDELPVIAQYGKTNKEVPVLIEKFVLEARKWNCYFIGAGQSTDAEILPTRVTDNLSSRIVFYSSNRRATMAGIDIEVAHRYLPLLKPDEVKGRMLFDCSRMSEPVLGAIPWIEMKDLAAFLGPMMMPHPKEQMAGLAPRPTPRQAVSEHREMNAAPMKPEDLTVDQLLALFKRLPEVDPTDSRYGGETSALPLIPLPGRTGQLFPEMVDMQRQRQHQAAGNLSRKAVSPMAKVTPDRALQARLEKALQLYNEGYTSVRKLEQASDFSNGECRRLLKLLEEHGFIEGRQRPTKEV